jgi:hypothetical protein
MSYKIYGQQEKGKQPRENAEMITFFNVLRSDFPHLAKLATHIRNEGERNINQARQQKSEGMVKGFSDIVIIGNPAFVCELKSKSKSSKLSQEQVDFLTDATDNGAFACVAYGFESAIEAVKEWDHAR